MSKDELVRVIFKIYNFRVVLKTYSYQAVLKICKFQSYQVVKTYKFQNYRENLWILLFRHQKLEINTISIRLYWGLVSFRIRKYASLFRLFIMIRREWRITKRKRPNSNIKFFPKKDIHQDKSYLKKEIQNHI